MPAVAHRKGAIGKLWEQSIEPNDGMILERDNNFTAGVDGKIGDRPGDQLWSGHSLI
jgi:hypothetical protein